MKKEKEKEQYTKNFTTVELAITSFHLDLSLTSYFYLLLPICHINNYENFCQFFLYL